MKSILHCRTYKKYYPLNDVTVKQFVKEAETVKMLNSLQMEIACWQETRYMDIEKQKRKLKKEVSILGSPLEGNILYNRMIMSEPAYHSQLREAEEHINRSEHLWRALMNNEVVDADMANEIILILDNQYRRQILGIFLTLDGLLK